jgi:hypothetical protein
VNNELEWTWKEAVIAQFEAGSRNFPEEIEGTTENLGQDTSSTGRGLNPEQEAMMLSTPPRYVVKIYLTVKLSMHE